MKICFKNIHIYIHEVYIYINKFVSQNGILHLFEIYYLIIFQYIYLICNINFISLFFIL